MLKLLKYELIHEWRSYGIIYLVFIAACALSPILFKDQILMNQAMVHTSSTDHYHYDDGDYHQHGDQHCAELPEFDVQASRISDFDAAGYDASADSK